MYPLIRQSLWPNWCGRGYCLPLAPLRHGDDGIGLVLSSSSGDERATNTFTFLLYFLQECY